MLALLSHSPLGMARTIGITVNLPAVNERVVGAGLPDRFNHAALTPAFSIAVGLCSGQKWVHGSRRGVVGSMGFTLAAGPVIKLYADTHNRSVSLG